MDEEEVKKEAKAKPKSKPPSGPMFSLKKWNAVAMWQWDVECDSCAICRTQVMGKFIILRSEYATLTHPATVPACRCTYRAYPRHSSN